ncbi:MAG: MarR family transcriptional regulator [Clostridia bacterium]|nr:MarR family transcriptional regulator [Clostridia bacterium]
MDNTRFTPFVLLIERISKNIKRIADKEMEPYGLRSSHVMCMLQLSKTENGLSSSSLADACGVDKAFISRVTNELLEKGYITKEEIPTKKYKTNFTLTQSGEEVIEKLNGIVANYVHCVNKNVPSTDIERFYEIMYEFDKEITGIANGKTQG